MTSTPATDDRLVAIGPTAQAGELCLCYNSGNSGSLVDVENLPKDLPV